jgi:hypothetical protein
MTQAMDDDWAAIDELPEPKPHQRLRAADMVGCRFIAGEPTPAVRGMFCCQPTLPDSPYCALHRAICYQRVAPKRAALQTALQEVAT